MQQTRFVVPSLLVLGLALFLAACSGLSGGITPSGVASGSQTLARNALVAEQTYKPITLNGYPEWVLRLGYVPDPNGYSRPNIDGTCSSPQLSLPNWTGSFKDGSVPYCLQMIGAHPQNTAQSTTLTTQVYAYKLTFSNGDVFDPTAINPSCDSVSPYSRFVDSPLYHAAPIVNGNVKLGKIQYIDAQSVGEWYKFVKTDKNYAVNFQDTGKPVLINVSVPASEGSTRTISGFCNGVIGLVNVNWLASQISTARWSVNQVSIVLLWDVFQTSKTFIYGGYHTIYQNKKGQNGVAGVITMSNPGAFSEKGIQDVHIAAHELGETVNDPFGDNIVPSWGHVGQQPNCQNNLEVGDPLTGTVYDGGAGIKLKGFTYHPQELVYFNWFTQQTKYAKFGADGVYSMSGTFTAPAKLCV
ncbi:MAG: hypothetical protein JO263_10380 [Candidatus Eremiobacteraeota bacterium]|nr:hypothetical protein [Candidatus Eremiobacteraeota bacterium]